MRTNVMLVGLLLTLGLAVPVAADAAGWTPAADDGMGAEGDRPGMPGLGRPEGGQRGFGPFKRPGRFPFIRAVLSHRQELGLTTQQADTLRTLGLDFWRAAIRRGADRRIAQIDLLSLRLSDPVDMGKAEAKVREIERIRGDERIAAIRTTETARAQLTAEQREKVKSLWMAWRQRRGGGEGGAEAQAAPEDGE